MLAYFIYKKPIKLILNLVNCWDNYIYNYKNAGQVLDFELYDLIARLIMIYKKKLEYSYINFLSNIIVYA